MNYKDNDNMGGRRGSDYSDDLEFDDLKNSIRRENDAADFEDDEDAYEDDYYDEDDFEDDGYDEYEEYEDDREEQYDRLISEIRSLKRQMNYADGDRGGNRSGMMDEISRLRTEMLQSNNNDMKLELMRLRQEISSKDSRTSQDTNTAFLNNEIARLKEEMNRNNANSMNSELARLREELNKKSIEDNMTKELEGLKRQLYEKDLQRQMLEQMRTTPAQSRELEELRNQMNRLRDEIKQELSESRRRSPEADYGTMQLLDEIRHLRDEVKSIDRNNAVSESVINEIKSEIKSIYDRSAQQLNDLKDEISLRASSDDLKDFIQDSMDDLYMDIDNSIGAISDSVADQISAGGNENIVGAINNSLNTIAKDIKSEIKAAVEDASSASTLDVTDSIYAVADEMSDQLYGAVEQLSAKTESTARAVLGGVKQLGERANSIIASRLQSMKENLDAVSADVNRFAESEKAALASIADGMAKELEKSRTLSEGTLSAAKQELTNLYMKGIDDLKHITQKHEDVIYNLGENVNDSIEWLRDELSECIDSAVQGIDIENGQELSDAIADSVRESLQEMSDGICLEISRNVGEKFNNVVEMSRNIGEKFNSVMDAVGSTGDGISRLERTQQELEKTVAGSFSLSKSSAAMLNNVARRMISEIDKTRTISQSTMDALRNDIASIYDKSLAEVKSSIKDLGTFKNDGGNMSYAVNALSAKIDNVYKDIDRSITEITAKIERSGNNHEVIGALKDGMSAVSKEIKDEFSRALKDNFGSVKEVVASSSLSTMDALKDLSGKVNAQMRATVQSSKNNAMALSGIANKLLGEISKSRAVSGNVMGAVKEELKGLYAKNIEEIKAVKDAIADNNPKEDIVSYIDAKLKDVNGNIDASVSDIIGKVSALTNNTEKVDEIVKGLQGVAGDIKREFASTLNASLKQVNSNIARSNYESKEHMKALSAMIDAGFKHTANQNRAVMGSMVRAMMQEFNKTREISNTSLAAIKNQLRSVYQTNVNEIKAVKEEISANNPKEDIISFVSDKLAGVYQRIDDSVDQLAKEFAGGSGSGGAQLAEIKDRLQAVASELKNEFASTLSVNMASVKEMVETGITGVKNSMSSNMGATSQALGKINERINVLLRENSAGSRNTMGAIGAMTKNIMNALSSGHASTATIVNSVRNDLRGMYGGTVKQIAAAKKELAEISSSAKVNKFVEEKMDVLEKSMDSSVQEITRRLNESIKDSGKLDGIKESLGNMLGDLKRDFMMQLSSDIGSVKEAVSGSMSFMKDSFTAQNAFTKQAMNALGARIDARMKSVIGTSGAAVNSVNNMAKQMSEEMNRSNKISAALMNTMRSNFRRLYGESLKDFKDIKETIVKYSSETAKEDILNFVDQKVKAAATTINESINQAISGIEPAINDSVKADAIRQNMQAISDEIKSEIKTAIESGLSLTENHFAGALDSVTQKTISAIDTAVDSVARQITGSGESTEHAISEVKSALIDAATQNISELQAARKDIMESNPAAVSALVNAKISEVNATIDESVRALTEKLIETHREYDNSEFLKNCMTQAAEDIKAGFGSAMSENIAQMQGISDSLAGYFKESGDYGRKTLTLTAAIAKRMLGEFNENRTTLSEMLDTLRKEMTELHEREIAQINDQIDSVVSNIATTDSEQIGSYIEEKLQNVYDGIDGSIQAFANAVMPVLQGSVNMENFKRGLAAVAGEVKKDITQAIGSENGTVAEIIASSNSELMSAISNGNERLISALEESGEFMNEFAGNLNEKTDKLAALNEKALTITCALAKRTLQEFQAAKDFHSGEFEAIKNALKAIYAQSVNNMKAVKDAAEATGANGQATKAYIEENMANIYRGIDGVVQSLEDRLMPALDSTVKSDMFVSGINAIGTEIKKEFAEALGDGFKSELSGAIATMRENIDGRMDGLESAVNAMGQEFSGAYKKNMEALGAVARRMVDEFNGGKGVTEAEFAKLKEGLQTIYGRFGEEMQAVKSAMTAIGANSEGMKAYLENRFGVVCAGIDASVKKLESDIIPRIGSPLNVELFKRGLLEISEKIKNDIGTAIGETLGGTTEHFASLIAAQTGEIIDAVNSASGENAAVYEKQMQALSAIARRMVDEFNQNRQLTGDMIGQIRDGIKNVYAKTVEEMQTLKQGMLSLNANDNQIKSYLSENLAKIYTGIDTTVMKIEEEILPKLERGVETETFVSSMNDISAGLKNEITEAINEASRIGADNHEKTMQALSAIARRMVDEFKSGSEVNAQTFGEIKNGIKSAYMKAVEDMGIMNTGLKNIFGGQEQIKAYLAEKLGIIYGGIDGTVRKLEEEVLPKLDGEAQSRAITEAMNAMSEDIKNEITFVVGEAVKRNTQGYEKTMQALSAVAKRMVDEFNAGKEVNDKMFTEIKSGIKASYIKTAEDMGLMNTGLKTIAGGQEQIKAYLSEKLGIIYGGIDATVRKLEEEILPKMESGQSQALVKALDDMSAEIKGEITSIVGAAVKVNTEASQKTMQALGAVAKRMVDEFNAGKEVNDKMFAEIKNGIKTAYLKTVEDMGIMNAGLKSLSGGQEQIKAYLSEKLGVIYASIDGTVSRIEEEILPKLDGAAQTEMFKNGMRNIAESLKRELTSSVAAMENTFSVKTQEVADTMRQFGKEYVAGHEKTMQALSAVAKRMVDEFNAGRTISQSGLEEIKKGIKASYIKSVEDMKTVADSLRSVRASQDEIKDYVDAKLTDIYSGVDDMVGKLETEIMPRLGSMDRETLRAEFADMAEEIKNEIGQAVSIGNEKTMQALGAIAKRMVEEFKKGNDINRDSFAEIREGMKKVYAGTIGELVKTREQVITAVGSDDGVKAYIDSKLMEINRGIDEMARKITDEVLPEIESGVKADMFKKGISAVAASVKNEIAGALGENFDERLNRIAGSIGDKVDDMSRAMQIGNEKTMQALGAIAKRMLEEFGRNAQLSNAAFDELKAGLKNSLVRSVSEIQSVKAAMERANLTAEEIKPYMEMQTEKLFAQIDETLGRFSGEVLSEMSDTVKTDMFKKGISAVAASVKNEIAGALGENFDERLNTIAGSIGEKVDDMSKAIRIGNEKTMQALGAIAKRMLEEFGRNAQLSNAAFDELKTGLKNSLVKSVSEIQSVKAAMERANLTAEEIKPYMEAQTEKLFAQIDETLGRFSGEVLSEMSDTVKTDLFKKGISAVAASVKNEIAGALGENFDERLNTIAGSIGEKVDDMSKAIRIGNEKTMQALGAIAKRMLEEFGRNAQLSNAAFDELKLGLKNSLVRSVSEIQSVKAAMERANLTAEEIKPYMEAQTEKLFGQIDETLSRFSREVLSEMSDTVKTDLFKKGISAVAASVKNEIAGALGENFDERLNTIAGSIGSKVDDMSRAMQVGNQKTMQALGAIAKRMLEEFGRNAQLSNAAFDELKLGLKNSLVKSVSEIQSVKAAMERANLTAEEIKPYMEAQTEKLFGQIDETLSRFSEEVLSEMSDTVKTDLFKKGISAVAASVKNEIAGALGENFDERMDTMMQALSSGIEGITDRFEENNRKTMQALGAVARRMVEEFNNGRESNDAMYDSLKGGLKNMFAKSVEEIRAAKNEILSQGMGADLAPLIDEKIDRVCGKVDEVVTAITEEVIPSLPEGIDVETFKRGMAAVAQSVRKDIERTVSGDLAEAIGNRFDEMTNVLSDKADEISKAITGKIGEFASANTRAIALIGKITNRILEELSNGREFNQSMYDSLKNGIKGVYVKSVEAINSAKEEIVASNEQYDVRPFIEERLDDIYRGIDGLVDSLLDQLLPAIDSGVKADMFKRGLGAMTLEIKKEFAKTVGEDLPGILDAHLSDITDSLHAEINQFSSVSDAFSKNLERTLGEVKRELSASKEFNNEMFETLKTGIRNMYAKTVEQLRSVQNNILESGNKEEIIDAVGEKLDEIYSSIDDTVSGVTQEILSAVGETAKTEELKRSMQAMGAQIKGEITNTVKAGSRAVARLVLDNAAKVDALSEKVEDATGKLLGHFGDTMNLIGDLAKRMIVEFDNANSVNVKSLMATRSQIETIKQQLVTEFKAYTQDVMSRDITSEVGELMTVKLNSMAETIAERLENIKSQILATLGTEDENVRRIAETLDTAAKEIKKEVILSRDYQLMSADDMTKKVDNLASDIADATNKRLHGVLEVLADKVNKTASQIATLDIPAIKSEISKGLVTSEQNILNLLGDDMTDRFDRQQRDLIMSFGEQIKDIKKSLVDVIGQNEVIENIAKNMRDAKTDIYNELKKYDSRELIQEMVSQINLLSEYMLQGSKQSANVKAELGSVIDDLKQKIEHINLTGDVDGVREEIAAVREKLDDSKISGDMLVTLVQQLGAVEENLNVVREAAKEREKMMGALNDLGDKLSQFNESVNELKTKDFNVKMPSGDDDARTRAAKLIVDKLTQIGDALVQAASNGATKTDAVKVVSFLDRLSKQMEAEASRIPATDREKKDDHPDRK